MARKRTTRRRPLWLYALAALLLAALTGAAWYWWDMRGWAPSEATYPDQGVAVGEAQGLVGFETVRALGGKFAYLDASIGSRRKDARFTRNLAAAKRAGLRAGAVHHFDPCVGADGQSANFVTVVPRDADMLPPVIALDQTAENCPEKVSDAAVESELLTFVNQIELHEGKRVILKLSPAFEQRYAVAEMMERDLWLVRDRFPPRYAGRPWLLWSANSARYTEASEEPVEWVVVQP
ncbi:glycoside hydrolase family 25 protein [Altererythrobacter sp.]|uniref:glycoside hydrolase family 25 protein n=1 Tax=Altererythrobacter sp. TaxID=1872480 RepID=UPI003D092899